MKIIILGHWEGLKNRPDKLAYYFFNFLRKKSKYDVILCETVESEVKKIIDINDILIVFTCSPQFIKNLKNKKIYYIEDILCTCKYGCKGDTSKCGFNDQYNYINDQKFDYVWYKYETPITKRLSTLHNNCYKFPHMIFDKNIHKDYNLEKKYDILFYGATYPNAYPFRNRLYRLLYQNQDKFNIKFLPYTKKHSHKMTIGVDLYKLINQSWLTCACCLVSSILVAKYYEIGLCGSVVLGDYPEYESEQYLKQNMIYINRHMSDEDILNSITEALNNKKMLSQYSNNTKQYFSKNYMYENGLQKFEELISLI